jgi:hypothetical protein
MVTTVTVAIAVTAATVPTKEKAMGNNLEEEEI